MTEKRKHLLFFSLGVLIAVAAMFAIFFVANNVVAQSGGEDGQSSSELSLPLNQSSLDKPDISEPGSVVVSESQIHMETEKLVLESENEPMSKVISYRVVGSALKLDSYSATSEQNPIAIGCVYTFSGSAYAMYNTGLNLPQGATISSVRMYVNDRSSANSTGWLMVFDSYGELEEFWRLDSAGDAGNMFFDSTAINHVVNYDLYSYALAWRPNTYGNLMQICGFQVFYEPPPFGLAFLPLVQR